MVFVRSLTAFAWLAPSLAAGQDTCKPPLWFVTKGTLPRTKTELLGYGRGFDVAIAQKEARREIGQQLAAQYNDAIFALQNVRGQINRKIHTPEELENRSYCETLEDRLFRIMV